MPAGREAAESAGAVRPQCPECLSAFDRRHPLQLFCSIPHRDAWNARMAVRSRVLFPFSMTARITRDGTRGDRTTGKKAASLSATLIQRWRDEDRAAGRMPWPDYLARRLGAGFDPL